MTMRRIVLIMDVDVPDQAELDEYEDPTTLAEYPHVMGSFVLNEVNNCVEMPGRVVDYTARWTEYDTTDGEG